MDRTHRSLEDVSNSLSFYIILLKYYWWNLDLAEGFEALLRRSKMADIVVVLKIDNQNVINWLHIVL